MSIDEHPDVALSYWRAFANSPPFHIDQVIDRHECGLPDWFVPLARGAAIADDVLLLKAQRSRGIYKWQPGYRVTLEPSAPVNRPGPYCVSKLPIQRGVFESDCVGPVDHPNYYPECLLVRQLMNQLWTIELWALGEFTEAGQVLVHRFGSTPIVTRTLPQAQLLAAYCWENQPYWHSDGHNWGSLRGGLNFRWINACPTDYQVAIEIARQRQIAEAALQAGRTLTRFRALYRAVMSLVTATPLLPLRKVTR